MHKIKLIWDLRGEDSFEIAKHHCFHLKEFVDQNDLPFFDINLEEINKFHVLAFIIVDEANMKIFRDALKPHRGLKVV